MEGWIEKWKQHVTRRLIAPTIVAAMLVSGATYELVRPSPAKAATAAPPSVPPLDDHSVGALLALDQAMETLAARVTPAIVNVTVTSKVAPEAGAVQVPDDMQNFFGPSFGPRMMRPGPQIEHGLGTGVIVSPDGYIVTNNHVIDGAMDIRVTMSDRKVLKGKLVGADLLTDLAVIKIDGKDLPNVPWGDSTKLHPGQTVLAFGNPLGFRFTVTRGIVSALNRPNPYSDDRRKPGRFIQTDAAINQGNSGGPLVNARGEVVGINTFLISPSGAFAGMGFAIPTQIVRPTVDALIKNGKVEHGRIGVGIMDVTPENSTFFKMTSAAGAVVTEVEPDSPGAKAGLRTGDVVTEIDGHAVEDAGELQVEVGQKGPGTTVHLQVLRDGKTQNVPVTLVAMGKSDHEIGEQGPQGKMRWGLGLSDLGPDLRDELRAPRGLTGALVEQVQPGSSADNAGMRRGDVIVEVDRKPVANAGDVQKALSNVPAGKDVLMLVWSNGGNTFRVLHAPEGA